MTRSNFTLALLGSASFLAYAAAFSLGDLRKNTIPFEIAFFAAFSLYWAAIAIVMRPGVWSPSRFTLPLIVLFALAFRLALLPSRPTLSDDMYRYVWDGRVQARGITPYRYPPNAKELAELRNGDRAVWPKINRKNFATLYPPGAQLAFAGIWQVVRDSVTGFKVAFVLAELLGAVVLLRLLNVLGQPPERLLIYLWSPLLVFEVAHAGHMDGLMLPLLIAAFWARAAGRPWLLGITLGAATLVKLFPAILLPALLPFAPARQGVKPSLQTLLGFGGVLVAGYLIYVFGGASVLGFLPTYFGERFNLGLAGWLINLAKQLGQTKTQLPNLVTFGGLLALSAIFVLRPATSNREALGRCVWLIGWFTLFTQNLFPWYLLWLLPLITLFLEPGKMLGLRLAPISAWLIFSGTTVLAYLFFVRWRPIPWAQAAEYWPLYALLLASLGLWLGARLWSGWKRVTPPMGRLQESPVIE